LYFAAMLCSVPLLLAPLAGRSAFETREERAVFTERFEASRSVGHAANAVVKISRDPFVADSVHGASDSSAGGIVGMHAVQGAPIGIAVPDAPIVRATVTGFSPRALIEEGGRVRIVAAGDKLAGSKVLRITSDAIVLQNGTLLKVMERSE
jgi:hypothetical protein